MGLCNKASLQLAVHNGPRLWAGTPWKHAEAGSFFEPSATRRSRATRHLSAIDQSTFEHSSIRAFEHFPQRLPAPIHPIARNGKTDTLLPFL